MPDIRFKDLPFSDTLCKFYEALHYCYDDKYLKPKRPIKKSFRENWQARLVDSFGHGEEYDAMVNFLLAREQDLKSNPLLVSLMDAFIDSFWAEDEETLKNNYEALNKVQRNCYFEENMQQYLDMGCDVKMINKSLFLRYPLYLYGAYRANGGVDDKLINGYLEPRQKLEKKQVKDLFGVKPSIISKIRLDKPECER